MKVCILGGDKRQLEIIKRLENSCDITLVGFENFECYHTIKKARMIDIDIKQYDCIILPVSGVNNDYSIKTLFGKKFSVNKNFFDNTKKNVLIFTGIITDKLNEMLKTSNRKAVILMQDPDVIKENTIPTVEGILADIIYSTKITINNANILVIGYGNIGKRLVNFLNMLGANVAVGVKEEKDKIALLNIGQKTVLTTEKEKMSTILHDVDIIINTVPTLILDKQYLITTNKNAYILDVSSYPYGVDFNCADTLGIKNKLLLGIPSNVAPTTSGLILTQKIELKMKEVK